MIARRDDFEPFDPSLLEQGGRNKPKILVKSLPSPSSFKIVVEVSINSEDISAVEVEEQTKAILESRLPWKVEVQRVDQVKE